MGRSTELCQVHKAVRWECSAEVQAEPPCRCCLAMWCLWASHRKVASCLQGLLLGSHEVDHFNSLWP